MKKFRKFMPWLVVLLLLIVLFAVWFSTGGVSNRAVYDKTADESRVIQAKIDARADQLLRKAEESAATMKRIESKLDQLLEIANRPLPDGHERVD